MKKVGAFDAKTHLSQLLTEVEQTGCEIIIQRRGKDVAVLAPCHKALGREDQERTQRILTGLREIRASQKRPRPSTSSGRPEALEGRRSEAMKDLVEHGRKR